jgi:uncharacterized protein (TIGR02246 family)
MRSADSPSTAETDIRALYRQVIAGWNQRSSEAMAAPFAEDGELIGFDGSQASTRAEIAAHLGPIFASHPTPPYVSSVKSVRFLGPDAAMLKAYVGMVPPGQSEMEPKLNAIQTLVAVKREGTWCVALLQTTPAQFHGRQDLVEQMTEELRQRAMAAPI